MPTGRKRTTSIPANLPSTSRDGPLRSWAGDARAHLVDDDGGRRGGDDGEVLHAAHEALETDRVGGPDDDEVVGGLEGGQGRGVAAGRGGVVAELLVVLEREPDVDDDVVDDAAGQPQHVLDRGRPQLGPPVGAGESGEHPQAREDLGREPGQAGDVERALLGRPRRRDDTRGLVDEPEHLGHARAPRVEVDEQGAHAGQRRAALRG